MRPAVANKASEIFLLEDVDDYRRWSAMLKAKASARGLEDWLLENDPQQPSPLAPQTRLRPDVLAKKLLISHLGESFRPPSCEAMTAAALWKWVGDLCEPKTAGAYFKYLLHVKTLSLASCGDNVDEYVDDFTYSHKRLSDICEALGFTSMDSAQKAGFLVMGTYSHKHDWLASWRGKMQTSESLQDLDVAIQSLFDEHYGGAESTSKTLAESSSTKPVTGKSNESKSSSSCNGSNQQASSEQKDGSKSPNSRCFMCIHTHRNKDCFLQHPELKRHPYHARVR